MFIYIDVIIVFSKTEAEHTKSLAKVFIKLQNANMREIDKCDFFKNEVDFLGFTIPEKGIKTNQSKI